MFPPYERHEHIHAHAHTNKHGTWMPTALIVPHGLAPTQLVDDWWPSRQTMHLRCPIVRQPRHLLPLSRCFCYKQKKKMRKETQKDISLASSTKFITTTSGGYATQLLQKRTMGSAPHCTNVNGTGPKICRFCSLKRVPQQEKQSDNKGINGGNSDFQRNFFKLST